MVGRPALAPVPRPTAALGAPTLRSITLGTAVLPLRTIPLRAPTLRPVTLGTAVLPLRTIPLRTVASGAIAGGTTRLPPDPLAALTSYPLRAVALRTAILPAAALLPVAAGASASLRAVAPGIAVLRLGALTLGTTVLPLRPPTGGAGCSTSAAGRAVRRVRTPAPRGLVTTRRGMLVSVPARPGVTAAGRPLIALGASPSCRSTSAAGTPGIATTGCSGPRCACGTSPLSRAAVAALTT